MKLNRTLWLILFLGTACAGATLWAQVQVIQQSDSVLVKTATDTVRIVVCSPTSIHVVASPDGIARGATDKQPWLIRPCMPAKFGLAMPPSRPAASTEPGSWRNNAAVLDTGALKILISLDWGNLDFQDEKGNHLLHEPLDEPRRYSPIEVNGQSLYAVDERFSPSALEGFYGLGQHQSGVFNYRGTTIELAQANTDVAVPLLMSTMGYGIFWNTAALSYFDNRFPWEMTFRANAAHAIDYYFLYGPEFDQIIQQYREMTGHAPLYGKWAYGFWQSKDRYKGSDELLKVAAKYREAHMPLDNIVQDWFWWVHQGDSEFLPDAYPNVNGMLAQLHSEHIHAMVSVWAMFDPKSQNFQKMQSLGLTIPGTTDYDATNPAAGDYYWTHLLGPLAAQGWDGFWLDSSEPEVAYTHGGQSDAALYNRRLSIGNGALYTNVFPLVHTGNAYTHWRSSTDRKRLFILTRSGFAGDQRYGATTWSGDVFSTFQAFSRQIPAGLNFALSGMPYWTTDIGGYTGPQRDPQDPSYQELYTRWYEFGTFCPIFRTHGHRDNNELFSYGAATPTLIAYDKLRYRLLPYIYSLAWKVTSEDATIMRPLVMDWRTDEKVWGIGDQFMFGPSIMVSPVTLEGATRRNIYLPKAARWYDFWTGTAVTGDKRVDAAAPVNRIPIYVKAGSIVPLGPEVEYAEESQDAPIELRFYRGANAHFDLYEDAGDTYDYEKGQYAIIPIDWNESAQTLSFEPRSGSYAGMPAERRFNVVVVGANHGVGGKVTATADQSVRYSGASITIHIQSKKT